MPRAVVTLSSGDNFLAGPEFNASLEKGPPFYDSIVVNAIGYDALAIGNHEFDFGPEVLADFIAGVDAEVPFLSANLDLSGEPRLQALADAGRIAASVVLERAGQQIAVIGATTQDLPFISSPRDVTVGDVADAVEAEIAGLPEGVDKVILISHLQSVNEDVALLQQLEGIDVAIAGGGDELLASEGTPLLPGDAEDVAGPYPMLAPDATGKQVPVVTTSGNFKYLGRLEVLFDGDGEVLAAAGAPVRVVQAGEADAVVPDAEVVAAVAEPVAAALEQAGSQRRRHDRSAAERPARRHPHQGDQSRQPDRRCAARARARRGSRVRHRRRSTSGCRTAAASATIRCCRRARSASSTPSTCCRSRTS